MSFTSLKGGAYALITKYYINEDGFMAAAGAEYQFLAPGAQTIIQPICYNSKRSKSIA